MCVALMSELKCLLSWREGPGPAPAAGEPVRHECVQMCVLAGCEFLAYSNRAAHGGAIRALPMCFSNQLAAGGAPSSAQTKIPDRLLVQYLNQWKDSGGRNHGSGGLSAEERGEIWVVPEG